MSDIDILLQKLEKAADELVENNDRFVRDVAKKGFLSGLIAGVTATSLLIALTQASHR